MKFEHELFCSFCKEMFDIYEDFKNHLRLEHNVDKNVDNIVQSEMKKAGHPIIEIIKSEVVEEVTDVTHIQKSNPDMVGFLLGCSFSFEVICVRFVNNFKKEYIIYIYYQPVSKIVSKSIF